MKTTKKTLIWFELGVEHVQKEKETNLTDIQKEQEEVWTLYSVFILLLSELSYATNHCRLLAGVPAVSCPPSLGVAVAHGLFQHTCRKSSSDLQLFSHSSPEGLSTNLGTRSAEASLLWFFQCFVALCLWPFPLYSLVLHLTWLPVSHRLHLLFWD